MIVGLLLALSGKRYARLVAPVFGALIVFEFIWIMAWTLEMLETAVSQISVMIISFTCGILFGEFIKRHPVFGNLFSGFGTGFMIGIITYVITLAASGWQSKWGMYGMAFFFAFFGLFFALKYRKDVAPFTFSFLGSFIFVKSCDLFFGGLPSESQIWKMIDKTDPVDFPKSFWYYIALFFITIVLTSVFRFP